MSNELNIKPDGAQDFLSLGALALLRPDERRGARSAVKLGWAHSALRMTCPGDTTLATVEQERASAKCGSARIQR